MFAPLQVNSAYSLLASPMSVADYVQRGKDLGYRTLVLSDQNVLYGVLDFYRRCQSAGIQAVIGLTVDLEGTYHEETARILLIAQNYSGYQALMRISTLLKAAPDQQRVKIEEEMLAAKQDLYFILDPSQGPHMQAIKSGHWEKALPIVKAWQDKLPQDRLFIGLNAQANEYYHLDKLEALSKQSQLDLIACPYVAYLHSNEAFSQRVLVAIDRGEKLDIELAQSLSQQAGHHYLESPKAYYEKYQAIGQEAAYHRGESLLESVDLQMPEAKQLLPKYPLQGQSAQEKLSQLAQEGLKKRLGQVNSDYQERLDHELAVIHEMGYDDYFLIVWDVIAYARQEKIMLGAGRGSAPGSLVAYSLEITGVDPIANQLLFERFLNAERQNMPDIDLDIPDNKRQKILDYVYKKYGADHVAQIATFGTFAARKAIRDVGSVLGRSQQSQSNWANTVPTDGKTELSQLYQESKSLQNLVASDDLGQLWLDTAIKLEGLPRHVSTHAAGVIISQEPLLDHLPLQAGSHGIWNSQFTMGDVEALGLLKMDFLSLINLTILDEAIAVASRLAHKSLDPSQFDRHDDRVYSLFRKADTLGIFQFESDGIRQVLRQVQPSSMEDLAAVNALFRPGPMQQINHFTKRKYGQENIAYPHPDLADILAPTYGVMVYQEQVMQVTQKIAGFSLGEADLLRRAISKKNQKAMEEMQVAFIQGAQDQGYDREVAESIYHYIEAFANYGFNKSHAFAYSYLAYALAWLKVYYPVAFYYGNLAVVNPYDSKGKQLILEAKQHGIQTCLPDVNASYIGLTVRDSQHLRLGLLNIKGLAKQVSYDIVSDRQSQGSYKDFFDFVNRLPQQALRPDPLNRLAMAGALDCFGFNRRTLVEEAIPKMLAHIDLFGPSQNQQGQLNFHGQTSYDDLFKPEIIDQEEYTDHELMTGEIETIGQALSINPYADYDFFYRKGLLRPIAEVKAKESIAVIGRVSSLKKIHTKKGDPMAFANLEDESGEISLTLFPDTYVSEAGRVRLDHDLYCQGRVEERKGYLQLIVQQTQHLNDALLEKLSNSYLSKCHGVEIQVANRQEATDKKADLLALVKKHPGKLTIRFTMLAEQKSYNLGRHYDLAANTRTIKDLKTIYGANNVKVY